MFPILYRHVHRTGRRRRRNTFSTSRFLIAVTLVGIGVSLLVWVLYQAKGDTDDEKLSRTEAPPALSPAGSFVLDAASGKPAVGSLPVDFVRTPDHDGPDGQGRYLVAVNSGYGLQFDGRTNRGQQSLAVIDLSAKPAPAVVQNVYFPTPQSACVGAVFAPPAADGTASLYVSGGFENKVWRLRFTPGDHPISPGSPGPDTQVTAPFIDLTSVATAPATRRYNAGKAAVYPLGLALAGDRLFAANNLDDSVSVIQSPGASGPITARVDLRRQPDENVDPYTVAALPLPTAGRADAVKVYVSLWNAAAVAVFEWPPLPPTASPGSPGASHMPPPARIPTGSHPSALLLDGARSRLYVANANDDTISVIDTDADREVERVNVRLTDDARPGVSPEAVALSADGRTLYVADARADAVAVVQLGDKARGQTPPPGQPAAGSRVAGLIPTGRYPSALAVAGNLLFVGNGKGTGTENSSNTVNLTGRNPNAPDRDFPPTGKGQHEGRGGSYSVAAVSGNLLAIPVPDEASLARDTAQVLRQNGLAAAAKPPALFAGRPGGSPIKHVIYIIKENRTYDQVFGDVPASGDGTPADGEADLAIFGSGDAARLPGGPAQDITPNHRALAQRFGLLDRFFVDSEASADGHNWSTAAFSTDYVDKVFRWNYSKRGRSYDFEGFNRLPDTGQTGGEPLFPADLTAADMAGFLRKYLPYTHGGTDASEPATLYLWDLAARAGLSYRNYGEFVATASAGDLAAARARQHKAYPDISPTVVAVPAKASLNGHYCPTARNFDLGTPDAFTVDSYRAAREPGGPAQPPGAPPGRLDPLIVPDHAEARFRGTSRVGAWLEEFARLQADLAAGKRDALPALSILRLSNDHTAGLAPGQPSPQFYVADNDYALGRLVEAVSKSPSWKDTAIVAIEDDAQDGPDHVDCHRSVALVISAYNRPGALIHHYHTTAGVVRTIEELLGLPPMNAQDAAAPPIDAFRDGPPDLTPYLASLPQLDAEKLITPRAESVADPEVAAAIRRSAALDLDHADGNDPAVLNAVIWLSVRGSHPLPPPAHLPAYDLLRPTSPGAKPRDGDDDDD